MAHGVVHRFPGGTKKNYDASIATVHPSTGGLPKGQIFHAAGSSAGGWTIGIEGGFPTAPQETQIEIDTILP